MTVVEPRGTGGRVGHDDPVDLGVRRRGRTSRPFPSSRRLVVAAGRAGRRMSPMVGLLEVDVTATRRALAATDPPASLTAWVVACVGRAAARHPEVHAYRDWRGRLVQHRHVDVQVLVEIRTAQGPFGLVHVVRDADTRTVAAIGAELRAVKRAPGATRSGRLLETLGPVLGRVPGLYRGMYAVVGRSHRAHDAIGTVQVTAVGMYAGGGGFAIAPPSLASLTVVVGGVAPGVVAIDGRAVAVERLDLTVIVDHAVVDGAPATRFGAELRGVMERWPADPHQGVGGDPTGSAAGDDHGQREPGRRRGDRRPADPDQQHRDGQ